MEKEIQNDNKLKYRCYKCNTLNYFTIDKLSYNFMKCKICNSRIFFKEDKIKNKIYSAS